MANEIDKPTQADLRGAPRVPNWEDFADSAVRISQRLFAKLEAALAAGAPLMELEAIRKQIEQLGNEVRVAGLVIGLMTPFKPKRRKTGLIMKPITFTTPLNTIKTIFPWLQTAWDFLSNKKVVKASDFASLSIDQQQAAFTAPGMEDRDELKKLRDEIAKGQNSEDGGESLADFRKRIGDSLSLTRVQSETTFRTNVHQGFIEGFDKAMKSKLVSELFPCVMLSATADSRVRELHWEMDNFVCLKSDPAYKLLLRLTKDWNCRCSIIPLSLEQAKEQGVIKNINDVPADVLAKYGQGLSRTPAKIPEE